MTYRNQALRDLPKHNSLPCVDCGTEDGTVVWAHSNLQEHGKGMGLKAHDACGMLLCHRCHARLDQGGVMTKVEASVYQKTMIIKTYMLLFTRGLFRVVK